MNPDGKYFATSHGLKIKVWKWNSQISPEILAGQLDTLTSIAFSPDGNTLVTASQKGQVYWWRFS